MPAPKFYCDYCDKTFVDAPAARRRHFSGPQHQRAKKLWFDSFKEETQSSGEGLNRGVCAQFSSTGLCPYGDRCKYVHLLPGAMRPILQGSLAKPGPENNLPPSLQPPQEHLFHFLPPVDWG